MSGGVPASSRARSRKPIGQGRQVKQAASLFERFTGHEAEIVGKLKLPDLPKYGVNVGDVDFIGYTTMRDGREESYIHKFAQADKPMLVISPDGRSIYLLDGRYKFTERGIVDRTDKS
jgi:hypothetical protein